MAAKSDPQQFFYIKTLGYRKKKVSPGRAFSFDISYLMEVLNLQIIHYLVYH